MPKHPRHGAASHKPEIHPWRACTEDTAKAEESTNAAIRRRLTSAPWQRVVDLIAADSVSRWERVALKFFRGELQGFRQGYRDELEGAEAKQAELDIRVAHAKLERSKLALSMLKKAVKAGDTERAAVLALAASDSLWAGLSVMKDPWDRVMQSDADGLVVRRKGGLTGGAETRARSLERAGPFHLLAQQTRAEHPSWKEAAIWNEVVNHPDSPKDPHGDPYTPDTARKLVKRTRAGRT